MYEAPGTVIKRARRLSGMSPAELARRERGVAMLAKLVEAIGHRLLVDVIPQLDAARGLPDTPMGRRLRRHRRAVTETARQRGATNVRVFGSVARGDDTDTSDVDLLVDLASNFGLVGLAGLRRELADLLGRDVDVVPAAGLKAALASKVHAEAIPL